MSKQLYEEAIADLKKVKEIAEDNAKRAVVEAVAPRIRELIEKELLAEGADDLDEDDEAEVVDRDEKKGTKRIVEPKSHGEDEAGDKKVVNLSDLAKSDDDDSKEKKNESVNASIKNLVSAKLPVSIHEMEQKLRYVEKMVETLAKVDTKIAESKSFDSDLSHLGDMIDVIYEFVEGKVEDPTTRLGYGLKIRKCLEKLEKLQETTMKRKLNEDKVTIELDLPGVDLGEALDDASVDLITGEGEEGGEEEEGEEGGEEPVAGAEAAPPAAGEEEEEGKEDEGLLEVLNLNDNAVVEIDENMLRREIAFMKLLREADESESAKVPSVDGSAPGKKEFAAFGGADEDEDADDDDDLLEAYDLDEMGNVVDDDDLDEAGYELDLDELSATDETNPVGKSKDEGTAAGAMAMPHEAKISVADDDDDLLEVEMDDMDEGPTKKVPSEMDAHPNAQSNRQKNLPENATRVQMAKELKLQESLRSRAAEIKKLYESAKRIASQVSTITEAKKVSTRTAQLKAAYAETAERYNKSVVRFNNLSQSLPEGTRKNVRSNSGVTPGASTGNTLSKKLAETNLLNAKLLFTNKLLQTESLTARQKSQIIEQLDAAETIREAKLVYESLSKALVKPRRTVTEGRVFGSSSQATRAASTQTLSEGVEAERWAKLAGISK